MKGLDPMFIAILDSRNPYIAEYDVVNGLPIREVALDECALEWLQQDMEQMREFSVEGRKVAMKRALHAAMQRMGAEV